MKNKHTLVALCLAAAAAAFAGEVVPLKDAYPFKIGTCLNARQTGGRSADLVKAVAGTFNTATPENELKPGIVQPREGEWNFGPGDRFVEFCEAHSIVPIGHCLVWHSQAADWMFTGPDGKPASRELLLERMRTHIKTVVGRYKGRIKGWDVVNEAIEGDGSLRKSRWLEIIGPSFIPEAFRAAHEADPDAELYYNDYGMESEKKRETVVRLVRSLRRRDIRIDAVGMQTHHRIDGPDLGEYEKSLVAFAAEGVKVMATEVDVSVLPAAWGLTAEVTTRHDYAEKFDPYRAGLPEEKERELAKRYCDLFAVFMRHRDVVSRVTFWGVCDADSWLNGFPVRGRTDYPLLYDRNLNPKACLRALFAAAASAPRRAVFDDFVYEGRDSLPALDAEREFRNPIFSGMAPDPSITRKGDDYFLAQSSFSYYPGIPVWHSKNLVDWDFAGYVGDSPENLNLRKGVGLSAGVFAPDIKYNKYNDTFYLIVTVIGDRGNVVYKTKDPYKGWGRPIPVRVPGIDPGFYFEDDKTAWIVNNQEPSTPEEYPGHRAVWLRKYDLVNDRLVDGYARELIQKGIRPEEKPIWCEGPHIYKIGGRYYLMTAEGGTSVGHSEVIWTADSVEGPYTPCRGQNPILTQKDLPWVRERPVTAAGHADLFYTGAKDVSTAEGFDPENWYAVFLAMVPYQDAKGGLYTITGRSTFLLPVKWEGEGAERRPVILKSGERVPEVLPKGALQRRGSPGGAPRSGNIVYRDSLKDGRVDPSWFQMRTPTEKWYEAVEGRGFVLEASRDSAYDQSNRGVLARWVGNKDFTTSVDVDFEPGTSADLAGLVLQQNEKWNYVYGVTCGADGRRAVALVKCENGEVSEVAASALPEKGAVRLRVESRIPNLAFEFSTDGGVTWGRTGGDQDATILSTEKAGGFVASTIGLYVTSNARK